jgi:predicted metal-dependent phosphoesterase TrpH
MSDELVERMAAAGLVGLEAHHRDHGPDEVARALELARRLDLVVTGSSDYHGEGKLNRLAEFTTTPGVLGRIEGLASGVTEVVRP